MEFYVNGQHVMVEPAPGEMLADVLRNRLGLTGTKIGCNEAECGAHSTMTAILGRLATYSGKVVKWDEALNSNVALADFDNLKSFRDEAPVKPHPNGGYVTEELYEIAVPGATTVI